MAREGAARKIFLLVAMLSFLGFLSGGEQKSDRNPGAPLWWDLTVELKTEGEYGTREGETVFSGDYQLTVLWTGTMERDEEDYRLFHGRSETPRWKAQETADSPDSVRILAGDEFGDSPKFHMEYVLKKGDRLHFAFFVEGFSAPRAASIEKRVIPLPAAEECPESLPEPVYGSFIVEGSNGVSLEEKKIYRRAMRGEFAWTWERRQWQPKEKETSLFSARHRASVRISITPHWEK